MHELIFTARLTKDAEMRYSPQGTAVSTVPMAINEGYGDKKQTIWIRGTIWDKLAENLTEYLTKGTLVMCVAKLHHEDGNPRLWGDPVKSTFECVISKIELLGGGKQSEEAGPDIGDGDNMPY